MKYMHTLLKRAADPQEVVDMILYLASDKASFITGTNYFVDGGRVILPIKGWGEYDK
jgi:NAD(P)-dependent dehydrogenase (short-subunit alcohol dehydrogenase family)